MTRGPMERPPGPRKGRAADRARPPPRRAGNPRRRAPARAGLTVAAAVALAALLVLTRVAGTAAAEPVEGQLIREVRIVGNTTVKTEEIRAHRSYSRKDRALSRDRADADLEAASA